MAFPLLAVGAAVVGVVLGVALGLAKKAPRQDAQEFQRPQAREGAPIIVVFGTCDIREPNTLWFGDTDVRPNYVKAGGKK